MTQGITSLLGAQQAPGQAAMPQVTPAPQAKTPASEIAPYQNMELQQLVAAFRQRPSGPLLGLITEKAKAEKLEQQMAQQRAMGAYAQQGPQTVKDMALADAVRVMSQPVMARHGGVMHGYAGGGAVAFQTGASPLGLPFPNDVGIFPVSSDMNPGETREEYIERKRKEAAESREMGMKGIERFLRSVFPESKLRKALYSDTAPPVASGTEGYSHEALVGLRSKPQPPAPVVAAPPLPPSGASRPDTGTPAAAPAPTAAPTGLNALMAQLFKQATTPNAELARIGKESEKNTQEMAALLQRLQSASPEEAEARRQFYETMQGAYAPQRKALEEAKAAQERGLLQSPEALARLAAAFGGAKRVGQGLSAAAGAAGEFMGEQRKRVERLSESYDTLSAQLNMTLAQARLADAQNDEKRKRELLLQAQGLKDRLLATQMDLLKTGTEMRRGDISGLAGLLQAGKPTDFQQRLALFRSDPKAYEAMFGSKDAQMLTRVQQVTNTDPLLKELAGKASMNMPGALEQYNARYRELIAQHAPELLLAGTGGAPGGGALSAATNIVRGGQ